MIKRSLCDDECHDEIDIHDRWLWFKEKSGKSRREDVVGRLTKRELDVLSYLVCGEKNKDIAACLGVKTVTVKVHVSSICRKLDVANRTQAALYASEHRLFEKKK
ncbi:MAG: response regulator transcription factor [Bdellovibrionales bacterium]